MMLLAGGLMFVCAGCDRDNVESRQATEFELKKHYERGPLNVNVRVDRQEITIAETLLLEFEAAMAPAYELNMPKVDTLLQNFGLVDWDRLEDRLDENNNVVSTYRYELEPFLSGTYELPAFTFEFNDPNDPQKQHELTTEPLEIKVTSLLGEDRENLSIADIEGVVAVEAEPSRWWIWPLTALPLVLMAGGLWLWFKSRKVELVRILKPAHEIAYARLRALVKDNLVEAGRIKEFYERISNILRHYIEDRFKLHAPERTTEEFLNELRTTDALSEQQKKTVQEFLKHCDLVKFARHEPQTEQIQRTFDLVRDFIEQTKDEQSRIDVTDRLTAEAEEETAGAA